MRNAAMKVLTDIAKQDKNIVLLTGDLGFGVLNEFRDDIPERFFNAGICEQNMTDVAVGLALEGKKVFTYSIANFPIMRCYEQVRNDVAYHEANVNIISVGAGFGYGSLGMSHHATEDISAMRCIPNMVIFSPGDFLEAEAVMKAAIDYKGPCYIRLGKGREKSIHEKICDFVVGKAVEVFSGKDICIMSTGAIGFEAKKAAEALIEDGYSVALYSFPTIKPLDKELICECAKQFDYIITVEENTVMGGFGSAVAEVIAQEKTKAILKIIGIEDCFSSIVGDQEYLRDYYGLSAKKIEKTVLSFINK